MTLMLRGVIPALVLAAAGLTLLRAPQFKAWSVDLPLQVNDVFAALGTVILVFVLRPRPRYLIAVFALLLALIVGNFLSLFSAEQSKIFQAIVRLAPASVIGILYFVLYCLVAHLTGVLQSSGHRKTVTSIRAVLALPFLALLTFTYTAWDFQRRLETSAVQGQMPAQGIVFTGNHSRIWYGLNLLKSGEIEQLFISGVNSGAGVTRERFIDQFSIEGELLDAWKDGRLTLGESCCDTFQNAEETACWVEENNNDGTVVLITSQSHMPRSSYALESAARRLDVQRVSLQENLNDKQRDDRLWIEFQKFVATQLVMLTPSTLRPFWEARLGIRPLISCD